MDYGYLIVGSMAVFALLCVTELFRAVSELFVTTLSRSAEEAACWVVRNDRAYKRIGVFILVTAVILSGEIQPAW